MRHTTFGIGFASALIFGSFAFGQGLQDTVFYDGFDTGDTAGWWAPAVVGETGQTSCYAADGTGTPCVGTGQDGELRPGVAWPSPRFVDNADGTVTDMLTGLVWLRDASCGDLPGVDATTAKADWTTALTAAGGLADGTCGLSDGSTAGDWRLPSRAEMTSLIDLEYYNRPLSDAAGTGQWTEGDAFVGVLSRNYWSSTTSAAATGNGWYVNLIMGNFLATSKTSAIQVWPVRNGP